MAYFFKYKFFAIGGVLFIFVQLLNKKIDKDIIIKFLILIFVLIILERLSIIIFYKFQVIKSNEKKELNKIK